MMKISISALHTISKVAIRYQQIIPILSIYIWISNWKLSRSWHLTPLRGHFDGPTFWGGSRFHIFHCLIEVGQIEGFDKHTISSATHEQVDIGFQTITCHTKNWSFVAQCTNFFGCGWSIHFWHYCEKKKRKDQIINQHNGIINDNECMKFNKTTGKQ